MVPQKKQAALKDFAKAFPPLKTAHSENHVLDSKLREAAPSIPSCQTHLDSSPYKDVTIQGPQTARISGR